MTEAPDLPDESPEQPAGGAPGHGADPGNRVAPGRRGQTAADASGDVLSRLKAPRRDSGGPGSGGSGSDGSGSGGVGSGGVQRLHGADFQQTDSSLQQGGGGTSYIGGSGYADVDIQQPRPEDVDKRKERTAERWVATWFGLSVLGTLVFVVMNFAGNSHRQYYTPVLGASLCLALSALGIGVIHLAKRLMPDEEAVQEREPHFSKPEEREATEAAFARGFAETGLGSRPLVRRSLLGAAGALGLIALVPVLNFGHLVGRSPKFLNSTRWRKGMRMVNQDGVPVKLGDVAAGGLYTLFPGIPKEGSPKEYEVPDIATKADSTILLIRLRPGENRPVKGRENYTYASHIAYSKICTHAGCPVSLYEQQTHHLLCPCHQSIFDVIDGGRPIFGPAARSLPQLAIDVDSEGYFIAQGDFSEPVGPSFWERG